MAKKKFTVDIDLDGNDILNCPRLDTIESDIAQEVIDRTNADTALQNAISQEVTDRQNADSLLQTDINNVASDLSTHESDTSNPHAVTLEQARNQNNQINGDINAGLNTIINIRDAVSSQEPITKSQFDSFNAAVGRQRGEIDCSANPNYPASNVGDRWEVSVAGKIGGASGITVQVYDEIVCKTASVSGDQATVGMNFYVVQGNIERASETVSGYTQFADSTETNAEVATDKAVSPFRLGLWFTAKKLLDNVWAGTQTFFNQQVNGTTTTNNLTVTGTHNYYGLSASQRLETDASKNVVTVAKGTADNKNFGTGSGEVCEGNDTRVVKDEIRFTFDGQGAVLSAGAYTIRKALQHGHTITGFALEGDVSGSVQIDLLKNGTSMVGAGNKIDLVSQVSDTGLPASWTSTSITAGDDIKVSVTSATTITKVFLTIKTDRTT